MGAKSVLLSPLRFWQAIGLYMDILSRQPVPSAAIPAARIAPLARRKTIFYVQNGFRFACPIKGALEESGYDVIQAESLDAALAIWVRSVMSIDLFLADLSLQTDPGIERLAKLLQAENPRMRILYANGLDELGSQNYPSQLAQVVQNCLS